MADDPDCPAELEPFQTLLRLAEDPLEEVVDVDPRCRRACGAGALPSAGRDGDAEVLEKLGMGNESTMMLEGAATLSFAMRGLVFGFLRLACV